VKMNRVDGRGGGVATEKQIQEEASRLGTGRPGGTGEVKRRCPRGKSGRYPME
jgi:hypothetical protein